MFHSHNWLNIGFISLKFNSHCHHYMQKVNRNKCSSTFFFAVLRFGNFPVGSHNRKIYTAYYHFWFIDRLTTFFFSLHGCSPHFKMSNSFDMNYEMSKNSCYMVSLSVLFTSVKCSLFYSFVFFPFCLACYWLFFIREGSHLFHFSPFFSFSYTYSQTLKENS